MNPHEQSYDADAEKKQKLINQVTSELNTRLVDMGEMSALDQREIDVLDSIRGKLGRTASYDRLDEEIPEELLKEYVEIKFHVEQEKLVKNLGNIDFQNTDEIKSFMDKYEQAKALNLEVDVDSQLAYVLGLNESE